MPRANKFDFIILAGHGTALGALYRYMQQFSSVNLSWLKANFSLPDFSTAESTKNGIILDNSDLQSVPTDLLNYCKDGFLLIVMTRDPLDQLLSVFNTHLYWWAVQNVGLVSKPDNLLFPRYGSRRNLLKKLVFYSSMWPVPTFFPTLFQGAGQTIITDVADFAPDSQQSTMASISQALFHTPDAWECEGPQSRMFTRKNRFFGRIAPLRGGNGEKSFSLSPWPKEYCDILKFDESLVLSYPPDAINFDAGDFQGEIAFVADKKEALSSEGTISSFMKDVRERIEANNNQLLRSYCENISDRVAEAEHIFSLLQIDTKQFFDMLPDIPDVTSQLGTQIRSHIALLNEAGTPLYNHWHSSNLLLKQRGVSMQLADSIKLKSLVERTSRRNRISSRLRLEWFVDNYVKSNSFLNKKQLPLTVLDIGSYNGNGLCQNIFTSDMFEYTTADMENGPNIDVILEKPYSWDTIAENSFDIIFSGQPIMQMEFYWITFKEIVRILKPEGLLCIIAPPPTGDSSSHRQCTHRVDTDGLIALSKYGNLTILHASMNQAPVQAPASWFSSEGDCMLIAQKPKNWHGMLNTEDYQPTAIGRAIYETGFVDKQFHPAIIRERYRKEITQLSNLISEKDNAISEKDNAISEKDSAISEKDSVISELLANQKKEFPNGLQRCLLTLYFPLIRLLAEPKFITKYKQDPSDFFAASKNKVNLIFGRFLSLFGPAPKKTNYKSE